ncbi:MAG: tripartite tricarboxylate transporter substrate binding protein [Burkholderiales bacterium]|nr:tripartite tricarboxylate transporter substrate binding protein [Burkholderiales bacterium]
MQLRVTMAACMASVLAAFPGAGHAAARDDFPARPLRVIVGYAAGGPTDVVLRPVAHKLAELLKQPLVIENRPGSNGNIGAEAVARATPDGYTLLAATLAQLTNNPHLYPKMTFDTYKDLQPVSLLATSPGAVVVHPSVPARALKELIALAKARPAKLNFSSTGEGSANHLAGELFKLLAGVDMVHIPFKGGAPALNAVVAGEVETIVISLPISAPFIKAGRLRALALCDKARSAVLPQLPTTAEAGLPGLESRSGPGILVPAGVPKPIVARLHAEIVKGLAAADVRDMFTVQGLDVIGNSPEEFATVIREDSARWQKVIKAANVRL